MFVPKYTISNAILKHIAHIEACREMINNAPLIPAWEKRFAEDAVVRTVHFGTHLEGNALELNEVRRVIEGERILASERDIQEVINYRAVMDYLDKEAARTQNQTDEDAKPILYRLDQLTDIHRLTMQRILPPEKAGTLRHTRVVIKNSQTGEITFSPPPPLEVPYQLEDFFAWINAAKKQEIHGVLTAGITHYELVRIHPFVDGNGRVARAFSTFVLYREGYEIKKFFALEEHFDKDAASYYGYLQMTSSGSGNLTAWLEYFTKSLAIEFERVREKILELSADYDFKNKLGRQITISERQSKIIRYRKSHDSLLMKQARKRILPDVSDDTILRDILDLVNKGIVVKEGRTKGALYRLK